MHDFVIVLVRISERIISVYLSSIIAKVATFSFRILEKLSITKLSGW